MQETVTYEVTVSIFYWYKLQSRFSFKLLIVSSFSCEASVDSLSRSIALQRLGSKPAEIRLAKLNFIQLSILSGEVRFWVTISKKDENWMTKLLDVLSQIHLLNLFFS